MHIFRMSFRVLIVSTAILLCFVSCKNIFEKSASDYPLHELTVESAVVDGVNSDDVVITFDEYLTSYSYYWDYNGDKSCDFSQLYYIPNLTPIDSNYYSLIYSQGLQKLSPIPTTIYFNTGKDFYGIGDTGPLGTKIERYRIKTSSASLQYQN